MSTADSLVLSCSAAITHDLVPKRFDGIWQAKVATAVVTMLALGIAMNETQNVFQLVILSWSTLASAFAPLLTIYAPRNRVRHVACVGALTAGRHFREQGLNNFRCRPLPGGSFARQKEETC